MIAIIRLGLLVGAVTSLAARMAQAQPVGGTAAPRAAPSLVTANCSVSWSGNPSYESSCVAAVRSIASSQSSTGRFLPSDMM